MESNYINYNGLKVLQSQTPPYRINLAIYRNKKHQI